MAKYKNGKNIIMETILEWKKYYNGKNIIIGNKYQNGKNIKIEKIL